MSFVRKLMAPTVAGLAVLVGSLSAYGAQVTVPVTATYVRSDNPAGNFATSGFGVVGTIAGSHDLRLLLSLNPSNIPAGSTITELNLRTWNERTSEVSSMTVELYALTRPFVESQATWQQAATGQTWTTPGGDFSTTLLGSAAMTSANNGSGVELPLTETAAFTSFMQSRVGTTEPVYLVLKASAADEALDRRSVLFYGTDNFVATDKVPVLEVTYVPEPAAASVLIAAGLLLSRRRAKRG